MKKMLLVALVLFMLGGCIISENVGSIKQVESFVNDTMIEETTDILSVPEIPTAAMIVEQELLIQLIQPQDSDFVRVVDYIPNVFVELKYSTADNFTGQKIYDFEDVFLRYGTVSKLKAVSEELERKGLYLKVWDGFRPVSAQFKLWEIYPDDTYVADPNKGFSNHSRGFAVDLTLVDAEGREMEMPTGFDDFSALADRDYSDCTLIQRENAYILEEVMEKHGFQGYWGEWWHFNDTQQYDVETCFDPSVIKRMNVKEDTALLDNIYSLSEEILVIPAGETITFLGYAEEFSLVEYWGYRGYVFTESLLDLD